jgi:hypothetical protein
MNPVLRNILAVIAGLFIGTVVNGGIISISALIIPPPNGADVTTMEGLQNTMHLFQAKHFIIPFFAHAIGTFSGAATTALLAINHKTKLALIIGAFFLLGGIVMVCSVPSPMWFTFLDLVLAYIPPSYLALKLFKKKRKTLNSI